MPAGDRAEHRECEAVPPATESPTSVSRVRAPATRARQPPSAPSRAGGRGSGREDGAPDDERDLVDLDQQTRAVSEDQQQDPGHEDRDGRGDEDGREHPQHHQRRALLAVGGRAEVIAGEAVAGAGELHQHRRDQQQPDEHVRGAKAAHVDDRHALGEQQRDSTTAAALVSAALPSMPPKRPMGPTVQRPRSRVRKASSVASMPGFDGPEGLIHNRGPVGDPQPPRPLSCILCESSDENGMSTTTSGRPCRSRRKSSQTRRV